MELLPTPDERQWLIHALKKVLARRGGDLLDSAPLVEPTNEWFPEPWSATAAHGHRLAQRMMHYASLGDLRLSLSAYEPVWFEGDEEPWDRDTAGWFAGIREGRAVFGLHVDQFGDPEAAAGVLAHEVAHAWREYHHLIVDDRDKEELLTDMTTVALGFGILSTNNTHRYRTSGDWSMTTWSTSSVGYLPPQAMAYLLALWSAARQRDVERRRIERHLEPNQLAFYRAALDEIAKRDRTPRELLGVTWPARVSMPSPPAAFVTRQPSHDEIAEPGGHADQQPNRGRQVYRTAKGDRLLHAYLGATPTLIIAFVVAVYVVESWERALAIASVFAVAAAVYMLTRANADACSACGLVVTDEMAICTACGGTLGRRVSARELRRLREEELEILAARDVAYEDCEMCAPEQPCGRHAAQMA